MRLSELRPSFLKYNTEHSWQRVETIEEADGVMFACPICFTNKGNTLVGAHSIICWEPSVPAEVHPKPGRWNLVGTNFEDLSLINGSSSVLLEGGCGAHFLVKNGNIENC